MGRRWLVYLETPSSTGVSGKILAGAADACLAEQAQSRGDLSDAFGSRLGFGNNPVLYTLKAQPTLQGLWNPLSHDRY